MAVPPMGLHCHVIGVLVLWITNRWENIFQPSDISDFLILRWSVAVAKVLCIRTLQKLTNVVCVTLARTRGVTWKLPQEQCCFGNQGLSSHSEETKKVRFLEFLVSWRNWVNLMVYMHKTFLRSTLRAISAENSRYKRLRYYVHSLMGS